jgi:hypothetical protein
VTIEVFVDDQSGLERVGIVMRDSSIVEYEDELCPGAALTSEQARTLAHALNHYADRVDE